MRDDWKGFPLGLVSQWVLLAKIRVKNMHRKFYGERENEEDLGANEARSCHAQLHYASHDQGYPVGTSRRSVDENTRT